jgi:16S rRNA (guanine527-N7)-methyltransferase
MTPERQLTTGAARLGVAVDAALADALLRYLKLLLTWNERINLTAIREPAEIIDKHFLDSLAVVPHIPPHARSLVDVGSGPGFPGAVIALARPFLDVTLVESNNKKAAFLSTLRRELPIANATVRAERAEGLPPGQYDVAISRATLDLPDWLELGATLVAPGGLVIGMEGADKHQLPPGATRESYELPGAERSLVFHVKRGG